jgi:hypothetical protein
VAVGDGFEGRAQVLDGIGLVAQPGETGCGKW